MYNGPPVTGRQAYRSTRTPGASYAGHRVQVTFFLLRQVGYAVHCIHSPRRYCKLLAQECIYLCCQVPLSTTASLCPLDLGVMSTRAGAVRPSYVALQ